MSETIDITFDTSTTLTDASNFTSVTDTTSGLSIIQGAALAGSTNGLNCNVNDTTAFWGVKNLGANDPSGILQARFYFDPNSFSMGNGDEIYLARFINGSSAAVANVRWKYETGVGYRIRVSAVNDAGTETGNSTDLYTITDAPHCIEIRLVKATTIDANDGSIQLWIDGVSKQTVSTVDNNTQFANFRFVRFGPSSGLTATTTGDFFLDELVVNNDGSYIGPIGGISTPMTLTGASTPSGTVTKSSPRSLAGGATPSGTVTKSSPRTLAGASTPSGTLAKPLYRTLAGASTPAGTLAKPLYRTLAGASTPGGALGKALNLVRTLAGATTPTGTIARQLALARTFGGGITPARQISVTISKTYGPAAIGASADDAHELATTAVAVNTNPLANCDTLGVWNAWIFRDVSIPANATIVESYMTVRFTSGSLDEPDVRIYGLDTAAPAAFQAVNGNISSRARTTAFADWSNPNAGIVDVNTASLNPIIAELLASYSYINGAMGFCWTSRAQVGTRDTSATSYDGSPSFCARLYIRYTYTLTIGLVFERALAGAIAMAGAIGRAFGMPKAGNISPSGVLNWNRSAIRTLTGAIAPAGGLIKSIPRALAGAITPGGVLTKIKAIMRTYTGTLTPSGPAMYIFSVAETLAGAITPGGFFEREQAAIRTFVGSLAASGTLSKVYGTLKGGILNPLGEFNFSAGLSKAFAGVVSSTGTVAIGLERTLAGAASSGGALVRGIGKTLAGAITATGTVTHLRSILLTFAGELIPSGVLARAMSLGKTLTGELYSAGELVKSIAQTLSGAVTSDGALTILKGFTGAFAGTLSSAGSMTWSFARQKLGAIAPSGELIKRWERSLAGAVSSSGNLLRVFIKTYTRSITPGGVMTWVLNAIPHLAVFAKHNAVFMRFRDKRFYNPFRDKRTKG